jgi:hypothetical protein
MHCASVESDVPAFGISPDLAVKEGGNADRNRFDLSHRCYLGCAWVRSNLLQTVGVAHDLEVKAPVAGDAGLPEVLALVVILRVQRRVTEILKEEG